MARLAHNPFPWNAPKLETEGIASESDLVRYIGLKLAALGHTTNHHADSEFLELSAPAPSELSPKGRHARGKRIKLEGSLTPANSA
jgi:hypothetical protein